MSTDTPAAAPTAEREAFEAHIERTHQTPGHPFNREMVLYRTETGRYFHGWLESQWYGWQARAALSAPAAQPADSAMDVLREFEDALTDVDGSLKGYSAKVERITAARLRARALVAKETPHAR